MVRTGSRPIPRGSIRTGAIGLALAASIAGCSRQPADPVSALLASLKRAAESRDAEGLGRQLTEDFSGAHGFGRADVVEQVKRYLAAYESVSIELADVETTRDADAAHVRCVVGFSGRPRRILGLEGLLPPEAAYRFELDVVPGEGGWRVRRADWQPAEPAPAPQ